MNRPKITVLMSVYNGENHLHEAVDSILNQTFKDFEFLIINDGSTDKTTNILKSYNDPRIKIHINKKNIGLTKSLNVGLKMAKGEYIARQDADDISSPERLAKEIAFLEKHNNYAVVGTFAMALNEYSEELQIWERPYEDANIRTALKRDNCIIHGTAMMRRSFLLKAGFYDEAITKAQDYDLWVRLSKKYKMANIPEFLYLRIINKKKLELKYIKEQQIFVALSKIKNGYVGVDETTKNLLSSLSKHRFIPPEFYFIFKLLGWIFFNRINIYHILQKIRFNNKVRSTLTKFESGKINFEDAKINIEKILNIRLFDLFL